MAWEIQGIWAVALGAALVYWLGFCTREDPELRGAAIKALSTGALAVVVGLSGLIGIWVMAAGLALGALGDWFLARRGETAFLAGMGAFAAGHLAYAGAMAARAAELGGWQISAGQGLGLATLAALVLSTEVWLAPRTGALRWPVRGYVLVIGLMGAVAILLPSAEGQGWLQLGAGLFLASDLLLALRLFVVRDKRAQRALSLALWPAYWGGQALIAFGALAYWGMAPG